MGFIPDPGQPFRLLSAHIQEMLCRGGNDDVGHRSIPNTYEVRDGSWWTLQRSSRSGTYLVVRFESSSKLFYNYERDQVGLYDGAQYDDQCWSIQFDPQDDSRFQLVNYHGGKYRLHLRDHRDPRVGGYGGANYPDQYFRFSFGVPIVKAINFQLDAAVYMGRKPQLVATRHFKNDTSVQQVDKFVAEYTQKKSHHFQYTGGFKISASMELSFKAGIPMFGQGESKFTLGTETSHQWNKGNAQEETKKMTYESPVTVPPKSKIDAKLVMFEESGEVPYQMTIGFKGTSATFVSKGKWSGVQSVRVDLDLKQTRI